MVSSSKSATYEPHRPDPLYMAMCAHLKSRQQAESEYRNLYHQAYAAFVQEHQAIRAEAWTAVKASHDALAATAAEEEPDRDAQQSAFQVAVRAEQEFCSGQATHEADVAAHEKFAKAVAEATETVSQRIAAGEREYIRTLKEAVADIDPDALDAETLMLFQQAVQIASPTATMAPEADPPAKPARSSKGDSDKA